MLKREGNGKSLVFDKPFDEPFAKPFANSFASFISGPEAPCFNGLPVALRGWHLTYRNRYGLIIS